MRKTLILAALLLISLLRPACARAEEGALPPPLVFVSSVLQLSDDQTLSLITMIQERESTIRPVAVAIQANRDALARLLEAPNPDAATVGRLLLAIHNGEKLAAAVAQAAASSFEEILTPDQRQRLESIRQAAQVAPALPAFRAVGLL